MRENGFSIANPHPRQTDNVQKLGVAVAMMGLLPLFGTWAGINISGGWMLSLSIACILVGTAIYGVRTYLLVPEGIKNTANWFDPLTNRGLWGWAVGIVLTGFYILLYWFPEYLGLGQNGKTNSGLIHLFDPLSQFFKGQPASQWFMYGTLYTVAILALGIKFIYKYRHSRYHVVRTSVVMLSQFFLAYFIPEILEGLNVGAGSQYYGKDLKNFWPLNYYFFDGWHLDNMQKEGTWGMFFLVWGIIGFAVLTPIITYFVGKRWYCSWVCGCGGLAETAGDPFRHLSDKSMEAWKIERFLIHGVLAFVVLATGLLMYTYFTGKDFGFAINQYLFFALLIGAGLGVVLLYRKNNGFLPSQKVIWTTAVVVAFVILYFLVPNLNEGNSTIFFSSYNFKKWYGFFVGATFSGVVGVGFYPLLGNRVWCRFGCPMAGYMGLFQRFKSRFRITTNGGQCISCGNCSTYCEQGIDVRAYAQRGENIVRASCVGCGVCSSVCPRGVLKLENGPDGARLKDL